ncbi:hypothetical protein DYB37_005875 [Aphanomyces astaci]|nr:hypothetical protein DYB37_005875 [Aphanomyces astaci]
MGIEKFCNIKCRASGLAPDCIVLVATIRALKLHGGAASVVAGKQLPLEYTTERLDLVEMGSLNLAKQIANAQAFHVPVVVAVSPFSHDSAAELELARTLAIAAGASDAVVAPYHAQGGAGAVDLAIAVQRAMQRRPDSGDHSEFTTLYTNDMCVVDKANAVGTTMYGASAVEFEDSANADLIRYAAHGFGDLPICIAKTQYSLSHDSKIKGVPRPFVLPIHRVRLNAGAGFITLFAGDVSTMPGLPTRPSFMDIDVDETTGQITGLF